MTDNTEIVADEEKKQKFLIQYSKLSREKSRTYAVDGVCEHMEILQQKYQVESRTMNYPPR